MLFHPFYSIALSVIRWIQAKLNNTSFVISVRRNRMYTYVCASIRTGKTCSYRDREIQITNRPRRMEKWLHLTNTGNSKLILLNSNTINIMNIRSYGRTEKFYYRLVTCTFVYISTITGKQIKLERKQVRIIF